MRLPFFIILSAILILISPALSFALTGETARKMLVESGWSPLIAEEIIARVENAQGRMVAVFDHDNTLVSGDITEGNEKNQPGFMNILLKKLYSQNKLNVKIPEKYAEDPWGFYHNWAKHDPQAAYGWICTLLAGQKPETVLKYSKSYYEKYMKNAIFPEMLTLVKVLQDMGVEVYVVSASAHNIVIAAAQYFNIPVNRVFGIRLKIENDRITNKIINPISFAAGKTWYIKNFVGEFPKGNIMTFGDSYRTDGHMLRFAARQGGLGLLVNPAKAQIETLEKNNIAHYSLPSKPLLDW